MKFFLLLTVFFFTGVNAWAQPWMSSPYFKIKKQADRKKLNNFYEIQKAFERYEKKQAGDYDDEQVALWMDIQGGVTSLVLPWILDAIEDMAGTAESVEETKKKAKPAK